MGQLADLARAGTDDDIQALRLANTQLKQQVRELSATRRQPEEKLTSVRSNNRFLDKRIASLEAQLVERITG